MSNLPQHVDFGEKIGGAKKDLWKKRGLYSEDLTQMNNREAEKFVKKDNVWKKPDYQAMIDSGTPFDVVYYIKMVRDSLSAAPLFFEDDADDKKRERQKQYIDTVRELQNIMESIKTKEDALKAFKRFFVESQYIYTFRQGISGNSHGLTEKGKNNPVITNKLYKTFSVTDSGFQRNVTQKAIKEQFGIPKENKIPKGYDIKFNDGKFTYSINQDWEPNTYYVVKGYSIVKKNFETKDEALKWVQNYVQAIGSDKKKRFVPAQLAHVHRDGMDYRYGKDVDGQDYLDTFKFRGGEFGNWMTQNDRRASLNYGFDALKDLADALSVSDEDISLHGVLSIAFGARGSGNFAAHYEPLRQVINLTKIRGAGYLAHEWWHSLDDYLGSKLLANGFLSDNPKKFPLFSKLINTIKYKPETIEQAIKRTEMQNANFKRNAERYITSIVYQYIGKASELELSEYEKLKEAFLRGECESVDKINELKKNITGRVIPKDDRKQLQVYERLLRQTTDRQEITKGRVETDYYRNSKAMGGVHQKDGGYWDSNVEMTARAFATYVMDKLQRRSDYLVGHAESAIGMSVDKNNDLQIIKVYPEGDERNAINKVFDELIIELKLQSYLTHEDKTVFNEKNIDINLFDALYGKQISLFDDYGIGDEDDEFER